MLNSCVERMRVLSEITGRLSARYGGACWVLRRGLRACPGSQPERGWSGEMGKRRDLTSPRAKALADSSPASSTRRTTRCAMGQWTTYCDRTCQISAWFFVTPRSRASCSALCFGDCVVMAHRPLTPHASFRHRSYPQLIDFSATCRVDPPLEIGYVWGCRSELPKARAAVPKHGVPWPILWVFDNRS